MGVRTDKSAEFKEFAGLRNNTTADRMTPADLQAAVNVDIDDAGRISRRRGTTLRLAGATHSLWADGRGQNCLAVQGTNLLRVRAAGAGAYATDTLRTDLTPGARMACWGLNGLAYYMNGHQAGVVQEGASRTLGLACPSTQPAAAPIGGNLRAGRYQYAVTFLRRDGQESGTYHAAAIDLATTTGIRFTGIPVSADPTVIARVIYLTAWNGEVLYRALTLNSTVATADYQGDGTDLRVQLATQFGEPAPIGHALACFRGHLLVAQGPNLFYSHPYRYELFPLGRAFIPFPADITLLAPVEDGVFVSADQTYFLSGASPSEWVLQTVAGYQAIPGTQSYRRAEGGTVGEGEGLSVQTVFWASNRGHCMGGNGGSFTNMTDARYSYPGAARGAGIVREVNGINQFLSVLEGTGVASNAAE